MTNYHKKMYSRDVNWDQSVVTHDQNSLFTHNHSGVSQLRVVVSGDGKYILRAIVISNELKFTIYEKGSNGEYSYMNNTEFVDSLTQAETNFYKHLQIYLHFLGIVEDHIGL